MITDADPTQYHSYRTQPMGARQNAASALVRTPTRLSARRFPNAGNMAVSRFDPRRSRTSQFIDASKRVCAEASRFGAYPFLHLDGPEGDEAMVQLGRTVAYASHLNSDIFKIFPGRVASQQLDTAARARSVEHLR